MITVPPAALQVVNPEQPAATEPAPAPAPAKVPQVPQAALDEFNAFLHYFEARHKVRIAARMTLDSRQGIRGEIVIDPQP